MNKYIRTKNGQIYIYIGDDKYSYVSHIMVARYKSILDNTYCGYGYGNLKEENILKETNDMTELVTHGDLINYFDTIHQTFQIADVKKNVNPFKCSLYSVSELYIKHKSNYVLVIKRNDNGEYEFVKGGYKR